MKNFYEVEYKRPIHEMDFKAPTVEIQKNVLAPTFIEFKTSTRQINYHRPTIILDKKNVILMNLIKLWASDFLYYEEIRYISQYHAYEIFNP